MDSNRRKNDSPDNTPSDEGLNELLGGKENNTDSKTAEDSNTEQSENTSVVGPDGSISQGPTADDTSWYWPDDIATKDEVVAARNPHFLRSFVPYLLSAAVGVAAVYFAYIVITGQQDEFVGNYFTAIELTAPGWFDLIPVVLGIISALAFASEYIRRRLTWYIITDDTLYVRRHILFRYVGDFGTRDITKIGQADPFPLNRLNIGHVRIYTASTDEWEADLTYVKNPNEFRKKIRRQLVEHEGSSEDT